MRRRGQALVALAQLSCLQAGAAQVQGRHQRGQQAFVLPGFGNKVGGTLFHGFDRQFHIAMGSHHHHHSLRIDRQDLGKTSQPFAAVVGTRAEIHVQQQHIKTVPPGQCRQLRGIAQRLYRSEVALQKKPCRMKNVFIIIHHQDAGIGQAGRLDHVFIIGQVSGFVYVPGQCCSE